MKPIGKDHEAVKHLRKHIKRGYTVDYLVCEELGVLEKYASSCLKDRIPLKTLVICEEQVISEYATGIKQNLKASAKDVYTVSEKTYALITEKKNAGGIVGVFEYLPRTLDDFVSADYKKVVVLDGLENPGNVGTIMRTADATGIDAIVAVDLKTHVNGNKCVSASRGMLFNIPFYNFNYLAAQTLLKNCKYTIYLGEPETGVRYDEIEYAEKCAVVMGSERFGINKLWYAKPHQAMYIPMQGSMTSLNVGVAASIIMYELLKQDQ